MQSLSGVEVTSLNVKKLGRRQVLSVSDNSGNLHLLEIPPLLSQMEGDEMHMLDSLFSRETRVHEIKLKREAENQKKLEGQHGAGHHAPPPPPPAEKPAQQDDSNQAAEAEDEEKGIYDTYLRIEKKLVNQLTGREESETDVAAA